MCSLNSTISLEKIQRLAPHLHIGGGWWSWFEELKTLKAICYVGAAAKIGMISPLQCKLDQICCHIQRLTLYLSISERLFNEVTWNSSFARSISVLFEELKTRDLCYVGAAAAMSF